MELSSTKYSIIYYLITMIIGCISLFPYVILSIVYFLRKAKFDIIAIINLQLIISCTLDSISFIIPNKAVDKVTIQCQIQIIFSTFSKISMYSIAFFLAVISLLNFSFKDRLETNKLFVYLIIGTFCWVIPILCGIMPSILNQIKYTEGICYVNDELIIEIFMCLFLSYM